MSNARRRSLGACLGLGLVAGCGPAPNPQNIAPVESGGGYQAQYRDPPARGGEPAMLFSARLNAERCTPHGGGPDGGVKGSELVKTRCAASGCRATTSWTCGSRTIRPLPATTWCPATAC
ncbi:hypothetical protein [Salipiger sp. HF18]|uniref:hypothetical protein n=1 Tax=Salipiger sp. HF18 TaxID=2721557 RepID=UPI0020CAD7E6|nr:hypothetical protein [Salipiger sp. HF18]